MSSINLSNALAMLCNANQTCSISYRKGSKNQLGKFGTKEGVTVRNPIDNRLSTFKKFGADGIIKLWQPSTGQEFDIIIDLLVTINSLKIIH
jgi:hypothetical protein